MSTEIVQRRAPKIVTLDTVEPKEITWLWQPYIPQGTVTAIFGRGGMGKSFLTCDIAARLSRGDCLPDGPKPGGEQKVLMLSAEDDYPTVLVPRLIKMKANLKNIAVPDMQFTLDPWGAKQVTELMHEFAATVVFIDPIVYYAGGKMDMNKSNEVRAMMETLKKTAAESQSSVIIVGHIRKSEEGAEADRMMGSADWINAARSGLLVTKANDGSKIMKHVKTNYGAMGLARSFEITNEGFEWGTVYDEDDLPVMSANSRKEKAVSFLKTLLADGPVHSKEVMARAEDEGISPATLNRAKPGVAESIYSKTQGDMWQLVHSKPVMDNGAFKD